MTWTSDGYSAAQIETIASGIGEFLRNP